MKGPAALDGPGMGPLQGCRPTRHEEVRTDAGFQAIYSFGQRVVVVRISGVIAAGADTNRITRFLSETVTEAPAGVEVFFDLEGFTRYDSDVRVKYTEAVREHGSKVERIWVYADSKLVRMGTSVAGLALRQLRLVDRDLFDERLRAAIAGGHTGAGPVRG